MWPNDLEKAPFITLADTNAREMGIGMPGLSKARIADEDGNECPAGTPGRIHFLSKGEL